MMKEMAGDDMGEVVSKRVKAGSRCIVGVYLPASVGLTTKSFFQSAIDVIF